jgi:lipopolysaccharide transport system ATP-binding protein
MTNKNIAIKVEGISKLYRIGARAQANENLAGAVASFIKAPLSNLRKYRSLYDFSDVEDGKESNEVLWALREVSFNVEQGEVLGIIGTNGAGKSTLLKILSRITPPSKGRIEIRGRVGSLLEVGTGFHPELTGRDNIYLNGTILGMRKTEVDRKFDEIVDFSGMERFLDTPVKRYSSGMRVRLAFAVAAHLEPEILIIDEVLAVGDIGFQQKCLGKMENVAASGRTVLFVSHSMPTIQNLCNRVIYMSDGAIVDDGPTREVVREYLNSMSLNIDSDLSGVSKRGGNGAVRVVAARILDDSKVATENVVAGQAVSLVFDYRNYANADSAGVRLTIYNHQGVGVTHFSTSATGSGVTQSLGQNGKIMINIPRLPLPLGRYRVNIALDVDGELADHVSGALGFNVVSSTFFKGGKTPRSNEYCTCLMDHEWEHTTDAVRENVVELLGA